MLLEGSLRRWGAVAYNCTYAWWEGSGWTNTAQERCKERSSVSSRNLHHQHPHLQHHPPWCPPALTREQMGWHRVAHPSLCHTPLCLRNPEILHLGSSSKALSSWRMRIWLTYTVQARGEDSLHINEILFCEQKNENIPWRSFFDQKVVIPRNNWLLWIPTFFCLFVCF